jgi:superfamily II DNA/RNA helicase
MAFITIHRIGGEEVHGKHVRAVGRYSVVNPCDHAERLAARDAAKADFNAGRVHVIVLNAAGGESLDLQTASIVLFYDLPWSWTELQQVIGRARRIGSPHEKVLAVLLINPGIDQHTKELLQDKESLVGETFGLDVGQMISAPPAGVQQRLFDAIRQHAGTGAPAATSTARRGGTSRRSEPTQ